MEKVGFIGLGTMGLPMARNLARQGIALKVWNRTEKPRTSFPAEVTSNLPNQHGLFCAGRGQPFLCC